MTVSDEGVLSWQTTSSSPELNEIIVSFSDEKDRIIYSSFQLKVEGGITDADGSALENDSSTKELAFEQIDLTPSVMETESKTIVFPSLVDQAISGGRGRLIIAYLPKQHCVAVVDLEEAKIVKFLNAPRSNPVFAVGANHLLMYDDQRRTLSRYNLTTFECEVTKPIPFEDTISSMGMGSGSYGPVMVKVEKTIPESSRQFQSDFDLCFGSWTCVLRQQ